MGILHALIFGADGACIDMGISSLLPAVAAFMTAVVVLQLLGSRLLRALLGRNDPVARVDRAKTEPKPAKQVTPTGRRLERSGGRRGTDPKYDDGPIRSTRPM